MENYVTLNSSAASNYFDFAIIFLDDKCKYVYVFRTAGMQRT